MAAIAEREGTISTKMGGFLNHVSARAMTAKSVVYIIVERSSIASMSVSRTMTPQCQGDSDPPATVGCVLDDSLNLRRDERWELSAGVSAKSDCSAVLSTPVLGLDSKARKDGNKG